MESKIKNDNFIVIQGFMVNQLNLKGNELLIYACIYGFSQTEGQKFNGSLQYLADWTNGTRQGVLRNLKSLIEKQLICKNEKIISGVKVCEYYVKNVNSVNKMLTGCYQNVNGGVNKMLTNNIYDNNIDNINKEKYKKKFDDLINDFTTNEDLKAELYEFIKMRKNIKKPLTNHGLELLIDKLNKLAKNDKDKIKILQNSTLNSWQGIFELKAESKANNYSKELLNWETIDDR